jgi:hypothetical protein
MLAMGVRKQVQLLRRAALGRAVLRLPEQECTRVCRGGSRKARDRGAALHVCNQL